MNQPPPPPWSQPPAGYPPPGYPQQQGYPPPGPPAGDGPPGKKRFRFQMWMLGLLIVPVGIGLSIRDLLAGNSIELGGECSDSEHCKSHTCLTGDVGICTKTCSSIDPCPPRFSCEAVKVTLQNQAGFHDLGAQSYCMPEAPGGAGAAHASAPGASTASGPSSPSAEPTAPPSAPSSANAMTVEPPAAPPKTTPAKPTPTKKRKKP